MWCNNGDGTCGVGAVRFLLSVQPAACERVDPYCYATSRRPRHYLRHDEPIIAGRTSLCTATRQVYSLGLCEVTAESADGSLVRVRRIRGTRAEAEALARWRDEMRAVNAMMREVSP